MIEPAAEIDGLQQRLEYTFTDPDLLLDALTHKSYHFENTKTSRAHNERLEFLGDSVLGLAVAAYLYGHGSSPSESMMAKVKSYVVKGEVISEIAQDIYLGQYLLIGRGEEESGGREKSSILTNAMEAVIGAVYIDGGQDEARDLVLRLFRKRLEHVISSGEFHDYKTEFQEVCQERLGLTPEYRVAMQEGLDHNKVFTVEALAGSDVFGRGSGGSKKKAEQEAARKALLLMNEGKGG